MDLAVGILSVAKLRSCLTVVCSSLITKYERNLANEIGILTKIHTMSSISSRYRAIGMDPVLFPYKVDITRSMALIRDIHGGLH